MARRKNQCDDCTHNNKVRCLLGRGEYHNHRPCDVKKVKWTSREKTIYNSNDKDTRVSIFYSNMER